MVQLTRFSNHTDQIRREHQGGCPLPLAHLVLYLRLHSDALRPLETRLISLGPPSSTDQDTADYKLERTHCCAWIRFNYILVLDQIEKLSESHIYTFSDGKYVFHTHGDKTPLAILQSANLSQFSGAERCGKSTLNAHLGKNGGKCASVPRYIGIPGGC